MSSSCFWTAARASRTLASSFSRERKWRLSRRDVSARRVSSEVGAPRECVPRLQSEKRKLIELPEPTLGGCESRSEAELPVAAEWPAVARDGSSAV
eukprot:scaffold20722_cov33-Tisochrysis_lutea.AAC.3